MRQECEGVLALSYEHDAAARVFLEELADVVAACRGLDDRALLAASRCHGWAVLEVVVHLRCGLEEMLAGVATPTDAPADRDAASYWVAPVPANDADADDVDGILWTRRTASAYRRPSGAVGHLAAVADRVRPAVLAMGQGNVAFQGHVLRSGDLLATWAVELAVHHLDLTRELALAPPAAASLRVTRETMQALAGQRFPASMTDTTAVLVGAGRRAPTDAERTLLGPLAHVLPLLS
ncbi:MAG: maleylpyruvate isomerase N-terminal domain-containing protein [Dermatophilaceae bacterium]